MWTTLGHAADMSVRAAWVAWEDRCRSRSYAWCADVPRPRQYRHGRRTISERQGLGDLGERRGARLSRSESSGSATGHSTRRRGRPRRSRTRWPGHRCWREVGDVGELAEHGEAVAKADRDEELAVELVVEHVALPLAVGRRVAAQVDGDVEDLAARAADQLRLPGLGLEVQAAQRALAPSASGCAGRTRPRCPCSAQESRR